MRRLWVVVGGAVLLLEALILAGKILGPIDALREASAHYLLQVITLGFGPFEAILVLAAVLLLSWVVVAGERSRSLTWLLRVGVLFAAVLTFAGLYTAIDPPTAGVSIGRRTAVVLNGGGLGSGALTTTGRFAMTLPAVGVALIAGLAALLGVRALLQSRDTIIPVRPAAGR
jgi:hypothetical protein